MLITLFRRKSTVNLASLCLSAGEAYNVVQMQHSEAIPSEICPFVEKLNERVKRLGFDESRVQSVLVEARKVIE